MVGFILAPSPCARPVLYSAFHVDDEIGPLWYTEVVVDFVFIVDVGLNFRTSSMDADTKEVITDIGEISRR